MRFQHFTNRIGRRECFWQCLFCVFWGICICLSARLLDAEEPGEEAQPQNEELLFQAAAAKPPKSPDDVELDPTMLLSIEQRRRILAGETDAYYAVLAHARDTSYFAQKAAAKRTLAKHEAKFKADPQRSRRKFALFVDLFQHPEEYSGELLTFRGHIRKLSAYPADQNKFGLKTLYEVWLYTGDSQGNPLVAVCTSVPEGLPRGGDLVEEVEVTGYFFKSYVYSAKDAMRVAPLLLAQRLEWFPQPVRARSSYFTLRGYGVMLVTALLVVFFCMWQLNLRSLRRNAALKATTARLSEGLTIQDLEPPPDPNQEAEFFL